jgi:hypothetical protein
LVGIAEDFSYLQGKGFGIFSAGPLGDAIAYKGYFDGFLCEGK